MRKKYLSALLFGALLFASAGTFTSCKDYDDDIKNLQGQIDANADAIKALQDLVNNGDYVTAVKKSDDGKGIVFTFSKSGDQTVTLDIENGQEGDVLSIDPTTGELLKNGEPTGIKPATDPEEVKAPVKAENGVWVFLNDKGEYESTNIPVSGVTAVQNENKQWVLTITDANGAQSTVVVPSAASVMSDLVLAGWTTQDVSKKLDISNIYTLDDAESQRLQVKYCWLSAITKANYATAGDEITWSAQKEVKKGQVLTNLAANDTRLVTRVAPADLDLSGMSFTLQDSKGNTLPIGLNAAKNFTGTLTRAANSSINTILLDVTSDIYANAEEYTKLFQGVEGTGSSAKSNVLYSLVEASGARSNYGISNVVPIPYENLREPKVTSVDPEGTIVTGTTGTGTQKDPFIVDLNTPTRLKFNEDQAGTSDQVYDYYVEVVDKQAGEEFGFSTNIKDGTITLTKSIDLVTKTGLELNVYALRIDGKVYQSQIWVKPSSIMASAVTLKAGEQNIVPLFDKDGKVTNDGYAQFTVSLDEMFANMKDTDKQRWLSSVTGANAGFSISELKEAGNNFTGLSIPASDDKETVFTNDIDLAFLDKDGKPCDNTKATSLLLTVKYKNTTTDKAILTPYKEYSMNVSFLHQEEGTETSVLNTVGLTLTPTLPTLSDYMTKRSAYWDGNVLMAYFNDPTSAQTSDPDNAYLESKFDMNYGYTKLGWKDANETTPYCILDVNFGLDKDQKIGDVSVLDTKKGMKDIVNNGCNVNEITLGTVTEAGKKPFGYGEELNVLVGATYLGVYDYAKFEATKTQLTDAAYKIKVQSALEAGTIKPANGASITLTPSGASQNMKITADDINATAYNLDAPYNIFKDVVAKDGKTPVWGYNYIYKVVFTTPDEVIYQVEDKNGNAGKSAEAIDPVINDKGAITAESYVSLKGRNTTDGQETTIKVTVTDWYGYTKTVDLPVIIKKANTGTATE